MTVKQPFQLLLVVGSTVIDTSLIVMIRESSKTPKADITPRINSGLTFCIVAFLEQADI